MVEALSYRCTNPIVTMGLELFALGLVASQLAVYGLVIGELKGKLGKKNYQPKVFI